MDAAHQLPDQVARILEDFRKAAVAAFGADLVSMTLYGSAAENRLRPTSDVNVALVLQRFDRAQADAIREALRIGRAAIGLDSMFVLTSELPYAAEAFAEKFSDIARRRKVLHGSDVFAGLHISREATIARLKQVLLNLIMRTRRSYLERSLREEQLVRLIADEAGPLRSAAATLLDLEGRSADSPKQALIDFADSVEKDRFAPALSALSDAREKQLLPAGRGAPTLFALLELAEAMRERASRLAATAGALR